MLMGTQISIFDTDQSCCPPDEKIQKQISEERFSTAIEAHMNDPATGALINFNN